MVFGFIEQVINSGINVANSATRLELPKQKDVVKLATAATAVYIGSEIIDAFTDDACVSDN